MDFTEHLEREAEWIEKSRKQVRKAIQLVKMAGRLTGRDRKEAERLGLRAETAEETADNLRALELLDAQLANIGCYPELMAQCRAWDGETPIDIVGWTLDGARDDVQELKREKNMSDAEWELEQQRRAAENDTLTGSLFGDGGSFSIATESAQRVEPTPEEVFTRMDVDGPGMSSAEYGKLSKEERDKRGDKYGLLPQDEKERIATPGLNAVYAKAAEVQDDFRKIVEGIGAKLGLKVMMRTGLKGRERAMQKTTTDYHGDAGQLLDVFGGTLILSADNSFSEVEKEIRAAGMEVVRVKNGYIKKDDYGYADIKMNVKMPNGFIGEIILIEDSKNKVKFGIGHKIYEAGRAIQAELKDNEKNPDYDPERRKLATELVEALQRWSTACYTGASTEARQAMIEEAKEAYQRGLAYILHSSNAPSVQTPLDWEGEGINSAGRAQSEESSKSLYNWNTSPSLVAPQAPSWSPLVQNLIKSASSALNIENSIDTSGRNVNQENTGSASFSVIGPHARTWDKHADRAFAGRDDGKMRAEIDASQARLKGAWTAPRLEQEDIYALLGTLAEGNEQVEKLIKFRDAWDRYLELIRNEAHLTEKEKAELRGMKNWVPDTRNELTELADRVLKELGYDTTITKRSANRVEALRSAALMADVKTLKKYNKYRKDRESKLGDILDYPELFDAYPELKEMKVDGDETQANGSFSPSTRTISLNKSLFADPDKLRSTLLHEIQHAIQDIEGFAAGSNAGAAGDKARRIAAAKDAIWLARRDLNTLAALPEEARNIDLSTKDGRKKLEGVKDKLKQKRDELQEEHWRKQAEEHRGSTKKEREEEDALLEPISACVALLARASEKRGKNAGEIIDSLKKEIKQTRARLREVHGVRQSLSDYELYRRTAGEIESRNVQERRDWTAEQRQAIPFNDTLEYPGEAVNFGSFSVAEAKPVRDCVEELAAGRERGMLRNTAWGRDIAVPKGDKGKEFTGKKGYGVDHIFHKRLLHGLTEDEAAFATVCALNAASSVKNPERTQNNKILFDRFGVRAVVAEDAESGNPIITGFILGTNGKNKAVDADAALNARQFYALDELRRVQQVGAALKKAVARFEDIVNKNPHDWENVVSYEVEMLKIKQNARQDGTYMKAPNGEKTKLSERQWAAVRTEAFKKWFGDWERDPENASKVVDENGEPMVVYHGSYADFKEFDVSLAGKNFGTEVEDAGFIFTTSSRETADDYSEGALEFENERRIAYGDEALPDESARTYKLFVNLENPLIYHLEDNPFGLFREGDAIEPKIWDDAVFHREALKEFAEGDTDGYDYDGIILKGEESVWVLATEPGQIKSATENRGTYSSRNADITFSVVSYGQWARQALRRRPGDLVADKVLKRLDKWIKAFDTAVGSTNKTLDAEAAEKALEAFRGFIGSGRTEWDMKEEERKARARKKTRRSMLFFDRLSVMSRHYRNKKMLYLILKKYNSTRFDSSISLSGSARSK